MKTFKHIFLKKILVHRSRSRKFLISWRRSRKNRPTPQPW